MLGADAMHNSGPPQLAPTSSTWHSLVAHTPLFILILDRDCRIRFVNHVDASDGPADVLGKTIYQFCPAEYHQSARQSIERVFATGQPQVYEAPIASIDGNKRWYRAHLGPIFDGDQIDAVSLIAENITEWKQIEQERNRSHAILHAAIECLPFHVFALGPDKRYFLLNAAAKAPFGDIIGKRPEDVLPPGETLSLWQQYNDRAFAGERAEGEVTMLLGGEQRHHYSIITPIREHGEFYGILGINIDITKRKQAELDLTRANQELDRRVRERTTALTEANERLRQSEERYRSLLEACPDSVVVSDLDGRVVFASRQTWQLLGLSGDDPLIGRSVLDYVVEADRPRLAANLADVLRSGERRNTAYRALRKDGEAVPVETSSAVIRGPDDQPQAAMAVIRDASEQQQSREALKRERRTLLHMLKASDRERQTIAYDIHDGLAQHLAAATMHFQTYEHLIDEYPTKAKAAYDAGIALVQRAHAEARRLISGVRPPALDEAGVAVAIEHLVHEQRQPDGPRIDYHYDLQFDRLPAILEDTIYRIAGESLSNACTHSKSARITMSLVSEGDDVHLDVQDWGVGFDPEAIPDNRYGLEGMRQRVRLLGGELTIESTPGQGTRVHMTMPIVQ